MSPSENARRETSFAEVTAPKRFDLLAQKFNSKIQQASSHPMTGEPLYTSVGQVERRLSWVPNIVDIIGSKPDKSSRDELLAYYKRILVATSYLVETTEENKRVRKEVLFERVREAGLLPQRSTADFVPFTKDQVARVLENVMKGMQTAETRTTCHQEALKERRSAESRTTKLIAGR